MNEKKDEIRPRDYSNFELEHFRNTRAAYVDAVSSRGKQYKKFRQSPPTLAEIKAHLLRKDKHHTLFVMNEAKPNVLLGLVDVDAKQGEDDAQALAEYVADKWFDGNCFIEPSPGLRGRHIYFFIDVAMVKRSRISKVLNDLAGLIRDDAEATGSFSSKVCGVYGAPTYYVDSFNTAGNQVEQVGLRGSVLKLPYLFSFEEDLEALEGLSPILFATLKDMASPQSKQNPLPSLVSSPNTCNTPPLILYEHNLESRFAAIRGMGSARDRRLEAALLYTQKVIKRCPAEDDAEALEDWYVSNNLHSDPPINPSRLDALKDVIRLVSKSYDKSKAPQESITIEACRELVAEVKIPDDSMPDRQKLMHDDLALTLYAHTNYCFARSSDDALTLPHKAVEAAWRRLVAKGTTDRGYRRSAVTAARRLLQKAELIMLVDENYYFAKGSGYAMSWKLGMQHPMAQEQNPLPSLVSSPNTCNT